MTRAMHLSRKPVIGRVRPHVGRRRHAVCHVEEGGNRRNIPNVAIAEAGATQPFAIGFLDGPRLRGELDREIEHRALAFGHARGAIIHHHQFAEHWIGGEMPYRRAMRDQAIIASVLRRHCDRDHLALELGQARWSEHQIIVQCDESFEFAQIEGVSLEHVRHETELVVAQLKIRRHRRIELRLGQRQGDHSHVVGVGLSGGRGSFRPRRGLDRLADRRPRGLERAQAGRCS
jgi:hypothetical protein